jgi:hypothetical protein
MNYSFPLGADVVQLSVVIGAIIVAIVIIAAAIFLMRGGTKQKDGIPSRPNEWQGQSQGAGAWSQQSQPGANAWSNQQSAGSWGNQQLPPTAPANPWGNQQSSASPNPWGNQTQQSTPNPWDNQQQQPAANTWAAQQPSAGPSWDNQQQQPAANPWATQQAQQPASNPWATQQAQQPASNPWATQQSANSWGGAQSPSTPAQEAWNQPQQSWGQQSGASVSPSGSPSFGASSTPGSAWGAAGGGISQSSQSPSSGNLGWQQSQPGAFGQQNVPDNDKTIMRPAGASTGSGVGYVRVEEGKEPGRIYEVRKEALSIGRSRESDIFLEDLAVSRLHASIVDMGNGNYALKDEGSANGTKVNGQLVNKFQTYPLQEGYRIQLGQTVLVFGQR